MCEQNKQLKRHKWADVLIAIAEGREVQVWNAFDGSWYDWNCKMPSPIDRPDALFRVKPKIVRKYFYAYQIKGRSPNVTTCLYKDDDSFVEATFSDYVWFQRLDNSCVETEES